jgi:hypothetical protein
LEPATDEKTNNDTKKTKTQKTTRTLKELVGSVEFCRLLQVERRESERESASERGKRDVSRRGEEEENVCAARRPPRRPAVNKLTYTVTARLTATEAR